MKNEELIKKWLNGELSPAEWDVLKTLPEYRDYNRIVESAARFEKPDFDEERNLTLIKDRVKRSNKGK
jgi:transmembrane sensor